MLGMLGEGGEDRVERRLLGALGPHGVLHVGEHLAIILITLHVLEAAPPKVADEEIFHPGEQQVDPVLEISVRVDLGAAEIESRLADDLGIMVLAAVDLNEPAIEERSGRSRERRSSAGRRR